MWLLLLSAPLFSMSTWTAAPLGAPGSVQLATRGLRVGAGEPVSAPAGVGISPLPLRANEDAVLFSPLSIRLFVLLLGSELTLRRGDFLNPNRCNHFPRHRFDKLNY